MKAKLLSLAVMATMLFSANTQAQTPGTTTFNFTTLQPGTKLNLVMAVWVEDANGNFVSTVAMYNLAKAGNQDHLPTFSVKAGGIATNTANVSLANAVSGATLKPATTPASWGAKSFVWNGLDSTGAMAADGNYVLRVEEAWNSGATGTSDYVSPVYPFVKGAAINTTTPAGDAVVTGLTVSWVPTALGLDNVYKSKVGIYPNPSTGILNIDFNEVPVTKIDVVNVLGQIVKSVKVNPNGFDASQIIDLSDNANGLYIINVSTAETSSSYKVVLDK